MWWNKSEILLYVRQVVTLQDVSSFARCKISSISSMRFIVAVKMLAQMVRRYLDLFSLSSALYFWFSVSAVVLSVLVFTSALSVFGFYFRRIVGFGSRLLSFSSHFGFSVFSPQWAAPKGTWNKTSSAGVYVCPGTFCSYPDLIPHAI